MIVNDQIRPNADIMLIGKAPGFQDVKEGRHFRGSSGKLLRAMLRHVGIQYQDCFVTTVVDKRPHKNNFGEYYEDKQCRRPTRKLLDFHERVREKIAQATPKVIVCLGAEALFSVTGRRGIEAWRGCPLEFNGIPVIPTYHPEAVLRQYSFHPICELDLAKARRIAREGRTTPRYEMLLSPRKEEVLKWLGDCVNTTVAFDIESVGKNLRCLSLARCSGSTRTTICIPFMRFNTVSQVAGRVGSSLLSVGTTGPDISSYWDTHEEVEILNALAKVFADTSVEMVGQNSIAFDQPFIERELGFKFVGHKWDTMHMFHLLYPELPKSLSFFCSIYTDYENYWTDKVTQDDISEWTYNCWDSIVTLEAFHQIRQELEDAEFLNFYLSHLYPLAVALMRAQERGVEIDVPRRAQMYEDAVEEAEHKMALLKKRAGVKTFNPNSSAQLKTLIYDKMKCKKQTNKKGKVSTDAECLKKLNELYPDEPFFQNLMDYRSAFKLTDFLVTNLDENNRVHTSYNASGTETGRISSSKTIFGEGMNLMNIPKPVRPIFIAGEGKSFVKEDLSQAEARVVAEILRRLGFPALWEMFQDPSFDIHTWMGSMIYGVPETEVTPLQRKMGKVANHAGNYMAGPPAYMATAIKYGVKGVTYALAKELRERRLNAIPALEVWWKWVEDTLRATRTLSTCLGRRRIFFGRIDNSTIREAVAYEPQSIVGDVNNIIFRDCFQRLYDKGVYPVLQVHDEVVLECPDPLVDEVVKELRTIGNIPLYINKDKPLYIPLDIGVGKNWGELVDVT
jgi:uracil-DNA glycosylase family 4